MESERKAEIRPVHDMESHTTQNMRRALLGVLMVGNKRDRLMPKSVFDFWDRLNVRIARCGHKQELVGMTIWIQLGLIHGVKRCIVHYATE